MSGEAFPDTEKAPARPVAFARPIMAFCPMCDEDMEATDIVCPHCGYDFPAGRSTGREGLVYSSWADVALIVGMVVSAMGSLISALFMLGALIRHEWLIGLVDCPVAALYQLALFVVFVRIQDQRVSP